MEAIVYVLIFILGAFFGSFYTLATYRIPKKQDITHTRSYCPNCNHKLGFFDLFPILSYIVLGGKCRYCKKKISPRYLIIELLSGATFTILFYLMKIDIYHINLLQVYEYAFFALFITFVFLTAGIDKENRKIEKSVSVYGIAISLMYIVYLCIVEKANIYRYAIYIVLYIIILLFDTINLKKFAKNKYINGILLTLVTMGVFTGEYVLALTISLTLVFLAIYMLIKLIKNAKNKNLKTDEKICVNLKTGFALCVSNIISMIGMLVYLNMIF